MLVEPPSSSVPVAPTLLSSPDVPLSDCLSIVNRMLLRRYDEVQTEFTPDNWHLFADCSVVWMAS